MEFICSTADCSPPLRIAQLLTCMFLAILFLQSGIDKVVDRSGNIEWLTGHFASSPLAGIVPFMVTTVLDIAVMSRVDRRNFRVWSSTASRA